MTCGRPFHLMSHRLNSSSSSWETSFNASPTIPPKLLPRKTSNAAHTGSAGPQMNETPKPASPPPSMPPAMMLPCRAASLTLSRASKIRSAASSAVTRRNTFPRTQSPRYGGIVQHHYHALTFAARCSFEPDSVVGLEDSMLNGTVLEVCRAAQAFASTLLGQLESNPVRLFVNRAPHVRETHGGQLMGFERLISNILRCDHRRLSVTSTSDQIAFQGRDLSHHFSRPARTECHDGAAALAGRARHVCTEVRQQAPIT